MGKYTNQALALLLLIQILLIAFLYWPRPQTAAPGITFLEEISAEAIQRLEISDDQQNTISLSRKQANWVITSHDDIPAESAKIETLLTKLTALESSRLVTRTESSHLRLKVGPAFIRKISLSLASGASRTLYLGTSPSYKTVHVRQEGDNNVYLARDLSSWEAPADLPYWWRTAYLDVDPQTLTTVTLKNSVTDIQLEKKGEEWFLAGMASDRQIDPDALNEFLVSVSRLTVSEYLTKTESNEPFEPAITLLLGTATDTVTVTIGPEDEETKTRILTSSTSPFQARTPSHEVEMFQAIEAKDFLQDIENGENSMQ